MTRDADSHNDISQDNNTSQNNIVSDRLHPLIYAAMTALALWFILAIWASFDQSGYTGWLLAVVTGFILMAIALPFVLSRVGRGGAESGPASGQRALRPWLAGAFETWQGRLSGADAMVQILLPIGAAAIGITAIGIVWHLAAGAA